MNRKAPEIHADWRTSSKTKTVDAPEFFYNSHDDDYTLARHIAVKYDVPHEIVNRLIGKDEEETERLMHMLEIFILNTLNK